MVGKRTWDSAQDNSSSSATPANAVRRLSAKAAGKQRCSPDIDDADKHEPVAGSSRPQPPARMTQERFVPGLQTHVGGLQMSQNSSRPRRVASSSRTQVSTRLRRSLGPSEAIQPLVMSRQHEAERRASQSAIDNRSRSISFLQVPEEAEQQSQTPGVSPGWHVEAHGRQAMELQEGVRHEDEDGWTPLAVFPAATPQGKLIAHRAKLRLKARQLLLQQAPSRSVRAVESKVEPPSANQLVQSTTKSTIAAPLSGTAAAFLDPIADHKAKPTNIVATPTHEATQDIQAAYSLSDFEVLETLGTGTFGRVLLVRLKNRDVADRTAYFALKVLAKSDIVRLKQVSHINSERDILNKVQHPFLVNLETTFQDSKNCYMLLEYVIGGEIFTYLRRAGSFSVDVARFYVSTIVLAIEYMHSRDIVYRDLKPENLLVDSFGYTKITDFGFAKQVKDRTWTLCGTPEYLAPEIIECTGHGKAVDWWSLGILLFEMLAGYPPFYDPNPLNIYEKILRGNVQFPDHIDPVSRHLITSLLTADRSKRLGNLLGGAQDVKSHAWFQGVDWQRLEQRQIRPPIVPYLGPAGDTSNFSKYHPPRYSQLPGLFGLDPSSSRNLDDEHSKLFPDF